MSADTLRKLMAAGLEGEELVDVVASIDADQRAVAPVRSAGAERQARYRERHSNVTRDVTAPPFPDKEIPPTPPKEINPNPIPPSPPKGGSSPAGFDRFWAQYPHKVGKPDALKAFVRASQRTDLGTLMAGLDRYVAKTDDRPWCNPSTWLNQDRWADQPAAVARGSPQPRPDPIRARIASLTEDMANAEPTTQTERNRPAAVGLPAPQYSGR